MIDIYRRDAKAQRNPIDFALYISFFPQLIAGPIVRYHDICDQLTGRKERFDLAVSGVERIIAGFGKKMILANPLGEAADRIFALPADQLGSGVAWLGLAAYTLQIYLDFSGYSDMAIGLARVFGFNFLENFDYPYRSRSIQEFWRRWHISLSNWFRDYLYIPLGGNRVSEGRVWVNLVIIFLVCGFWHGANWTFVVWGALHGLFLVLERAGLGAFWRGCRRWPGMSMRWRSSCWPGCSSAPATSPPPSTYLGALAGRGASATACWRGRDDRRANADRAGAGRPRVRRRLHPPDRGLAPARQAIARRASSPGSKGCASAPKGRPCWRSGWPCWSRSR